jgi:hypothetical protein
MEDSAPIKNAASPSTLRANVSCCNHAELDQKLAVEESAAIETHAPNG